MGDNLIGSIIFAFSGVFLATAISVFLNRAIHRDSLKKYRKMTKKATAEIMSVDVRVYDNWETDPDTGQSRLVKEHRRYAHYEFTVDGQVYYGYGQIYAYGRKKKTKVYYDPQSPAESVPAYEKAHSNGVEIIIGVIFALAVIIGLPLLVMFLLRI